MTFHSIVRHWCRIYRPILDSPRNRRFFLTDSTAGVVELSKSAVKMTSPCVVMESDVSGGGPIARPVMSYPVYFFVLAGKQNDGDEAAVAKETAKEHARNFLAWLRAKREDELARNVDGDFARLHLDDYVDFQTAGPLENGWYAVLIQLTREEPLNLCIDENLYENYCECDGKE